MSVRVLINGAKGRMGTEAVAAVSEDPALELVGQADLGDDLPKFIADSGAQVVVDLTVASTAFENVSTIIEAGVSPVVGTSGLVADQVAQLQSKCSEKKLGGIIAPNFAIGAVLLMMFAKQAAKHMPDVEIIELHHDKKEDSPSGTAIKTAELIAESRSAASSRVVGKETVPGARGAEHYGVGIHSVRLPGLVAHQEVVFGGVGQTLSIRHDSLNRQSFMPGICLACREVTKLNELVYGLEHIL
ncbi:4-hydroxy-tetrahydrodipicolinate reductase [bacterium J17]|nr:4-hydroxy-tetrahydrodipicolinate reductase [bacterium J17]